VTWQDKCYFNKHIKEDESVVLLLAVTYVVFICLFSKIFTLFVINPLNTELNPICHLLALSGAHRIFHISRIRVNMVSVQYLLYRITEILED
jgi:hypothetical protein